MKVMVKSAFNGSDATPCWCTLLRDWSTKLTVKSHGVYSTMTFDVSFSFLIFSSVSPYCHLSVHQHILTMKKLIELVKERETKLLQRAPQNKSHTQASVNGIPY